MVADELIQSYPNIPHSYLKHLVVSHFIETLSWWLKRQVLHRTRSDPILFGDFKSGVELEGSIFNDQRAILLSISITLHASRTGRNRLDAILYQKYQSSIQTIESYLITLLLLSMPLSWSNF